MKVKRVEDKRERCVELGPQVGIKPGSLQAKRPSWGGGGGPLKTFWGKNEK